MPLFLIQTARAQITITSIGPAASTCQNNGSIAINASSPSQPLLYSIISGPVIQPVQTNPVFNSLPPGSYVIKVADGAGHEFTGNADITGNYLNPDFTVADSTPYCIGESNGKLIGNVIPGTGLAPFSWQTLAPSPIVAGPQASNLFDNIPAGNYTVRVTDACGSFRTLAFTLEDPNTAISFYGLPPEIQGPMLAEKVGCDSMRVYYNLSVGDNPKLPLTFKYNTSNGIFIPTSGTIIDSSQLDFIGMITVEQIIPGLTYGDFIQATIYNTCGDSTVSQLLETHPYEFYPSFAFNQCGNMVTPSFSNTLNGDLNTFLSTPVTYSFTNVATNTVVESGILDPSWNYSTTGVTMANPVAAGETYHFSITDSCGQNFQSDFTVPMPEPPQLLGTDIISPACMDSVVGTCRIRTVGFGNNAQVVLLSGPATLGSTKPDFEYTDTYSYPDTISVGSTDYFFLTNLTSGTYTYKVIDDCGNDLTGSFTILPEELTSLSRDSGYKKGCPGENIIYYGLIPGGNVTVTDLSDNSIVKSQYFTPGNYITNDSVLNLPAGSYEIRYDFMQNGYGTPINDFYDYCKVIKDTIEIKPYQTPEMSAGNAIMCNDDIHFVLFPDSTKGVPAYQYEIISGPQTFGVQSSNDFTITQPGTYTARIYDLCGNASTKQITVDTIAFDPIGIHTDCSSTSLVFPSSLYYTYEWLMPNDQVFVGDSLIFDPVTPADTGMYYISKIININGCIDTLHTSYHVILNNFLEQTVPFCQGTTVAVGTNIYDTPGNYADTLTTINGCDSIVVTHLSVLPQNSDTTQLSICAGDSIQIGGQYYSVPGFYTDSIQNDSGCYDLLVTDLAFQGIPDTIPVSICPGSSYTFGSGVYTLPGFYADTLTSLLGCDSISVLHLEILPYIHHAVQHTICENQSFLFGGNMLDQQGIYTDTLSTAHCDSIVTLTLTVSPYKHSSVSETICEGNHFLFDGNLLSQPGTYQDTLTTTTCDSIVTLTLTVSPYKYNAVTETICAGESYTFGGHQYTASGTYTDTLSASFCDSIVTVTLVILPINHYMVTEVICSNEQFGFGGTDYNHSGTYTHTFPTATCDSIVTLNLVINPAPAVNITSYSYETETGLFVQLNAVSATQPLDYWWTSNIVLSDNTVQNPTSEIDNPSWVYLLVTDENGCTATDQYYVNISQTSTLYIPNAFTPNGDESNQVFRVGYTNIASFEMIIFDRWGEVIFETHDIDSGWDGTYKGVLVQDGSYVYKVAAIGMDYVAYDKTGHITVLK